MCGIAGTYAPYLMTNQGIWSMTETLRHRGPDDEGFLAVTVADGTCRPLVSGESRVPGDRIEEFTSGANLYLGHRRLSIIDPSPAGHQPMSYADGAYWVVFNGEIYNYPELREELKTHGRTFQTRSDTEVLLAAYETWGSDCVSRFNGMWSFAIYDGRRRILFCSRDRFGVKPFYYTRQGETFAFASEIKALLALPFLEPRANERAIFDYLAMGFQEHEEEGFFAGVLELPPGHACELELTTGAFRTWSYYTLPYTDVWERFEPQRATLHAERVRELVREAVRLRLRSDVAVGSCLSGGLDSSTIVCHINDFLQGERLSQVGDRQKVFTACYTDWREDESSWAEIVVERTHSQWHRTFPTDDELLVDLDDLIWTQDIPFGSTSIYAQYRVMRAAAISGVKVILDGQGGDEIFAGYIPFYRAFFAEMLRRGDWRRLLQEYRSLDNAPLNGKALISSLLRLCYVGNAPSALRRMFRRNRSDRRVYEGEFWRRNEERLDAVAGRGATTLNTMLVRYLAGDNLKQLLRYEDRNSMRFSLEARTPFADDINLIEYMFRVPSSYKIHQGWSKYLLRQAIVGVVPDRIVWRRDKIGFSTPEGEWLHRLMTPLMESLPDSLGAFVDTRGLRAAWPEIVSRSEAGTAWRIINLALWLQRFKVAI